MTQKLNIILNLKAYSNSNQFNSPSQNIFNINKSIQGSDCNNSRSEVIQLNPSETKTLHNGIITLSSNITTTYDLSLDLLGNYILSHNSGTAPAFKTKRSLGSDATTEITVSRNANVVTFTNTAGTALSTSSIVIGDTIRVGTPFNVSNQGYFQVLAKTSTSISVVNYSGVGEAVTLGSNFSQNFKVYSSGPLTEGKTFNIKTGFSLVTQGSYIAETVEDDRIIFSSLNLPLETNVQATIEAYSSTKTMIYLESDEEVTATVNGNDIKIKPIKTGCNISPGVLLLSSEVNSLSITNNGINIANVTCISVE